jgi:hypothetical protein
VTDFAGDENGAIVIAQCLQESLSHFFQLRMITYLRGNELVDISDFELTGIRRTQYVVGILEQTKKCSGECFRNATEDAHIPWIVEENCLA